MQTRLICRRGGAAIAFACFAIAAFGQHYSLRMLVPLASRSHDASSANSIDTAGDVVGTSFSSSAARVPAGITRLADGTHFDMGTLADCFPFGGSGLSDVSPGGKIAGATSSICGGFSLAVTGSVSNPGAYITFPPLPGGGDSAAYGANENSVVGWSNTTTGCGGFLCTQTAARPMKWYGPTTAVELSRGPFLVAIASGVNANGVVVGRAYPVADANSQVAVRWDFDSANPIPLPAVNGAYSDGEKISENGVVVGQSAVGTERHATRWIGLSPTDLGAIAGHTYSIAYDINDSQGIVGQSKASADATTGIAVLWRDGQIIDLNTLVANSGGAVLSTANGINSRGWIAATGVFEGKVRGFVLVPCQGDLNDDGLVDDADFVIFVAAYNILDCADAAMPEHCPSDLNRDGQVDDADFVLFVKAYNDLVCP
ncbi:MAG: hypothetical protein ACREJD_07715 [Phycisphaerales bacterium]